MASTRAEDGMVAATRVYRDPIGQVSDARARAVLRDARAVITAEVRRRVARGRRAGYGPDDLTSIAEGAVVEASATWRPSAGRNPRTWAGQIIRWRLDEALERTEPHAVPEFPEEATPDDPLGAYARFTAPDEILLELDEVRLLEAALRILPDRRRTVVERYGQGMTFEEIGRELGFGHQYVAREYHAAVAALRTWCAARDDEEAAAA